MRDKGRDRLIKLISNTLLDVCEENERHNLRRGVIYPVDCIRAAQQVADRILVDFELYRPRKRWTGLGASFLRWFKGGQ